MNQGKIKKILVVDDESSIRNMIKLILTEKNYEVVTAENGYEGLKLFDSANPDLVITDIVMPDMEGIEFIRCLVKKRKELPIIVMSGNPVGLKYLDSDLIIGAQATLRKPFRIQELNKAITEIEK